METSKAMLTQKGQRHMAPAWSWRCTSCWLSALLRFRAKALRWRCLWAPILLVEGSQWEPRAACPRGGSMFVAGLKRLSELGRRGWLCSAQRRSLVCLGTVRPSVYAGGTPVP
jgi:hypothetical protein